MFGYKMFLDSEIRTAVTLLECDDAVYISRYVGLPMCQRNMPPLY